MKKLISVFLLLVTASYSGASFAISVVCNVGPQGNLTKTAYVTSKTEWYEYYAPGFFYVMLVSIDIDNNVRGQGAAGWDKDFRRHAIETLYVSRVDVEGAFRKINGSGGITPYSEDICQSVYTQIIY